MKTETTLVVFRKWKRENHEIIALFPAEDEGNGHCSSFMHFGQHGGADYAHCINVTVPATETEYADLKRELESVPYEYKLKVVKRYQRKHR